MMTKFELVSLVVLLPSVATVLFPFQCCAGFECAAEPMKDQKNAVEDVANEAVNLLWNLW